MIRMPGFPVAILPVATVASNLINFLLTLPILLVFLLMSNHYPTVSWLALPLIVAVQFAFTIAFAYLFAACHVPFRDTQHVLGIVLTLGFYLAPTFYDPKVIPAEYQKLYDLNPMVHILNAYRSIFLRGTLPAVLPLLLIAVVSLCILYLSYSFFVRTSYQFVEEI
jgi:lipopolysaccharide transport system permease protein